MDKMRKGFQALEANFKKLDTLKAYQMGDKVRLADQSARLAFALSKEMWGQMEQLKKELQEIQAQAGMINIEKIGGSA